MKLKKYETSWGNETLVVEITDLADQANGSVVVRLGGTAVFASATMSKNSKEGGDFFPLTVNYEERFYAAGRILGSRFMRREGRPTDEAVLTSRLIDRTLRPLFDQRLRREVQIVALALSIDGKNDPDIVAIIAASLALGLSDIPWRGPVGPVRIGRNEKELVVNPSYEERLTLIMENVFCAIGGGLINMIEANGNQIDDEILAESFAYGLLHAEKIRDFQTEIIKEIGKEKKILEVAEPTSEMISEFKNKIEEKLEKVLYENPKEENAIWEEWMNLGTEKFSSENRNLLISVFDEGVNQIIHRNILSNDEKRVDGRKLDEVRSLQAQVGYLPILHGSGVFYRGATHILSVVTLDGPKQGQLIEGMEIQTTKRFMHHYNFPPFSTGETGRMGSPGRREIGHGALAERALLPVIPEIADFPYTIRIVSEALASNGSTSQGSICAATLALMDAGVPIKNPVAGLAIGLMIEGDKWKLLTDIQGPEDHHGDMDFKIAGTKDGVNTIQMDIKVSGVNIQIIKEAIKAGRKAREHILEKMKEAITEPRKELSPYAPRVVKIMINPEKIREVIGAGGKVINNIIALTGAAVDVEQDGTIYVTGRNHKDTELALKMIEDIVREYEVGEILEGPVTRLFEFGAMVDIGGTEGLIHISELTPSRVAKVTDVVNIGDRVKVKVIEVDEKGRINLSLKQADPNYHASNDERGGTANKFLENNGRGEKQRFANRKRF